MRQLFFDISTSTEPAKLQFEPVLTGSRTLFRTQIMLRLSYQMWTISELEGDRVYRNYQKGFHHVQFIENVQKVESFPLVNLRCSHQEFSSQIPTFSSACNFIKKETLTQVFSCEFCEIFKKTFFYRTRQVTTGV